MPRSNFFRLGLKVAKSGFRTIGKKLSAADGLYKKYGSKVASVAKMLLPGYADKIDRAQSAISSAQQAGKAIKEGDVVAGMEALRGAAKTAGASAKVQAQASNAIEKAKKAQKVYHAIRG